MCVFFCLHNTQYMHDMILTIAGVTPAEKLLQMYNEKWGHNVDHVFEELRY